MNAIRSLRASAHPASPRSHIERLEPRIAPAFVGSVAGTVGTLIGDSTGEVLFISPSGGFLTHNRFAAGDPGFASALDFDSTIAGDQTLVADFNSSLILRLGGGDDSVSFSGVSSPTQIFGGAGNDTLLGSAAIDKIDGGPGNDFIDGNQGNDISRGGDGNDLFQWDPGDGSDTLDGMAGKDRLVFNGANIAENIDLTSDGSRARLFRNVANITLSLGTIESLTLNVLGGVDIINVFDLASTPLRAFAVDLGLLGAGDGAADSVVIHGSSRDDLLETWRSETTLTARGLSCGITIATLENSDNVSIRGEAGVDNVSIGSSAFSGLALSVDAEMTNALSPTAHFGTPVSLDAGLGASAIAVGTLGGFGNAIVTANSASNSISVLMRGANGLFDEPIQLSTGGKAPKSIALADFNDDGILDIAVSNRASGNVSVFLNHGDGTFENPAVFPIGAAPGKLRATDVDGDGNADLVAIVGGNRLSILPGDGSGAFGSPTLLRTGGVKPTDFLFEDFDADGNADIAVTHAVGNAITVLAANADGTYQDPLRFRSGFGATGLAIGDFDGDGRADLAVTHSISRFVSVLFNTSAGNIAFASPLKLTNPGANLAGALAVDDLDRDGRDDIVVSNTGAGTISIFRGGLPGTFLAPIRIDLDNTPKRKAGSIVIADLSGDGTLDIATANAGTGDISIVHTFFS